uniref:2Fe-2S ferredoxin-type domain-containing protein n=1 Tax=Oncorhynchus mykiss TaxID=8022 RepID=A0A8C7R6R0_ONCMY
MSCKLIFSWVQRQAKMFFFCIMLFVAHLKRTLVLSLILSEEKVTVYFINRDGRKITTSSAKGDSLLDLVVEQNLDIEGFGACEGTLACSTCHVILDQKVYNQLGPITDEENDMLDLAFGLTDTSRLGCQVCLSRDLEGITVRVPDRVNDMRRSDDTGPTL